jgi:hypothetical protein
VVYKKKTLCTFEIFFYFSAEKIIIPCSKIAHVVPFNILHSHKINSYLANSLAAAVSKLALYRLPTYRIIRKKILYYGDLSTHRQNTKLVDKPLSESAIVYSIYSKLPSILKAVLPSAT